MENMSLQLSDQQISQEQRAAALKQAKGEIAERNTVVLPTLKLKAVGGDAVEGVKEGEYYVTFKDKNDAGEDITRNIPVGPNPVVNIIKRLYAYSWYREENKAKALPARLMAWSNEIESFNNFKNDGNKQEVVLVDNPDGAEQPMIKYFGNYRGFKDILEKEYTDREGRKLLKFRNVLYVYLPVAGTDKCVFRFFVSNSGVTGVKDGQDSGDYKNSEPMSLIRFIESIHSSEQNVLFGTNCKLGSRLHTGGKAPPYYIPQFENAGPSDKFDALTDLYIRLDMFINAKFEADFGNMQTVPENGKPRAIDANSHDANFEDLPDRQ
jgi:hypothetical protein